MTGLLLEELQLDMKTRWHLLETDPDKDVFTVSLDKAVSGFFFRLKRGKTLTAWNPSWLILPVPVPYFSLCLISVTILEQLFVSPDPGNYVMFKSKRTSLNKQRELVFWNSNIQCVLCLHCQYCVSQWLSALVWISHLLFTFCTALAKTLPYNVSCNVSSTPQNNVPCRDCRLPGNKNNLKAHWLWQICWASPPFSLDCFSPVLI